MKKFGLGAGDINMPAWENLAEGLGDTNLPSLEFWVKAGWQEWHTT